MQRDRPRPPLGTPQGWDPVTERPIAPSIAARLAPLFVFAAALGLYLRTLMPGMAFDDWGEMQTVPHILGIAHPTGYPTYILSAWLFELLPLGSIAFRANLFAAVCVAVALAAMTSTTIRLGVRPVIAAAVAIATGAIGTVWASAVVAEVNPLHLALLALLVDRALAWAEVRRTRDLALGGLLIGLALGNHLLSAFSAPFLVLFALWAGRWTLIERKRLLLVPVLTGLLGLAVYAYIPIAASFSPALPYNHPTTWSAFMFLVTGEQFRGQYDGLFATSSLGLFADGLPELWQVALARATAHPRWIVDLWVRELGRERAVEALRADLEPAPLYLWHVPFTGSLVEALDMLAADGAEPVTEVVPGCIRAGNAQAAVRGRAVGEGRVLVTDAAAQLAALACGAHPGGVVVDVAAGRGTKTVQLQALAVAAGEPAAVYALDLHAFKMDVVSRRMRALGVPDVTTLVGDATALAAVEGLPAPGTADAVLLDAPCTGLGSLRRRPEKRWRVTAEDGERLAVLQGRMLSQAASLVSDGGRVVYSTCTVNRMENHDVVAAFLEREKGAFATADLTGIVPGEWRGDIGAEGWFQSVPRPGGPDGHFVAALTRAR